MILLICGIWDRKRQTNKMNRNKLIDTDNRRVITSGEEGGGRAKWVKGVKYTVTKGSWTAGGEHPVQCTDTPL